MHTHPALCYLQLNRTTTHGKGRCAATHPAALCLTSRGRGHSSPGRQAWPSLQQCGKDGSGGSGGRRGGSSGRLQIALACVLAVWIAYKNLHRGVQALKAAAVNCWCRGGSSRSATRLAAVPIDAASGVDHLIRVQEYAKAAAGLSMGTALSMLGGAARGLPASTRHTTRHALYVEHSATPAEGGPCTAQTRAARRAAPRTRRQPHQRPRQAPVSQQPAGRPAPPPSSCEQAGATLPPLPPLGPLHRAIGPFYQRFKPASGRQALRPSPAAATRRLTCRLARCGSPGNHDCSGAA